MRCRDLQAPAVVIWQKRTKVFLESLKAVRQMEVLFSVGNVPWNMVCAAQNCNVPPAVQMQPGYSN